MNRYDEAADKLRCWSLIGRCRRIGFMVPAKWLKYGEPPDRQIIFDTAFLAYMVQEATEALNKPTILSQYLERRAAHP